MKFASSLASALLAFSAITSPAVTILGTVGNGSQVDTNSFELIAIMTGFKLPNGGTVSGWMVNNAFDAGAGSTSTITPMIFQVISTGPTTYQVASIGNSSTSDEGWNDTDANGQINGAEALDTNLAMSWGGAGYTVPAVGDFYAGFHGTVGVSQGPVNFENFSGEFLDFFRLGTGVPSVGSTGTINTVADDFGAFNYQDLVLNRNYDFAVVVPEPSSVLLFGLASGLLLKRRRK